MGRIINLIKIAAKSLLKRNRGNKLFLICIIILLMIPTLQFNVTQSVMNQVASSQRKVFGNFTDIYYESEKSDITDLDFSDSDLSAILPGFHYEEYGIFSIVYQQEISNTKILRVGFADEKARALAEVTILEGSFPEDQNEVALMESMAATLGNKKLGEQIEIEGSKYTISGILQDFGYLWPQSEVQINNNAGPVNAFVSEQEAGRILQQTSRMTRQILIVRQLGVSNPIENDSYLLRNTNNSLENSTSFNVPGEFVMLMIIATLVSVFMILTLNRRRLTNRLCNYYFLGLCKSDILFIIRFELIFLGLLGTMLGIIFGCAVSVLLLGLLTSYFGQPIPFAINFTLIVLLFLTVMAGIILIVLFYSKYAVKSALREDAVKVRRFSQKPQKISPFWFEAKQNIRSLIALTGLVIISFCLLSFGVFYSRYFSSDVYEKSAGMLPKDYDVLFAAHTLPSMPLDNNELPFYFTDTYERLGGNSDFIEELLSMPAVEHVNAYKEINKLNVLITEDQIDDYIDAHDFALDKAYSPLAQTGICDMGIVREQFDYQDNEILVGAEILTYPADVLKSLEESVVEGKIDLTKIASGEEIVLRVPAFTLRNTEDGGVAKKYVPYEQDGAYNSTTFHVGDEILLSGILTDELINGPVIKSQADSFYRKDVTVKIGAIIRDTYGIFTSSGSFGKSFSILTLDEALPIYGLDATYSNISVYTKQGTPTEEISQMFADMSYKVPNMALEDFQMEVKTYKVYNLMIYIFVVSLLSVLTVTTLIIMSSQLLAKTQLNMRNNALLRINGLNFWRIVRLWLYQVCAVILLGCTIGVPLSLLLFKNFGSYSHFEILNQIIYYFPLVHFIYVFAGIVTIAILSAIPSLAYLLKHKNDVLYDIF